MILESEGDILEKLHNVRKNYRYCDDCIEDQCEHWMPNWGTCELTELAIMSIPNPFKKKK